MEKENATKVGTDKLRTKECNIISYNEHSGVMVIDFGGNKLQATKIGHTGRRVTVRYKGTLGKDFYFEV